MSWLLKLESDGQVAAKCEAHPNLTREKVKHLSLVLCTKAKASFREGHMVPFAE